MGTTGRALDIAIIGAGGAGLTAAWLLGDAHNVTLYEQESRLGGHAHTVDVELPGELVAVDSGVDFFWPRMWPMFTRLLEVLDVPVRRYAFTATLYATGARRLYQMPLIGAARVHWSTLRPHQLSTMLQFRRALQRARSLVESGDTSVTVAQFVESLDSSRSFKSDFLHPLLLAGWCMEAEDFKQVAAYDPLRYLVLRESRGLGRSFVREVVGGTRAYIRALANTLTRVRIKLTSAIKQVTRPVDRYLVQDANGKAGAFDHMIIATNAREACGLLTRLDGTDDLRRELAGFDYFKTRIAIHGDARLMPPNPRHWSVINVRRDGASSLSTVWKRWSRKTAIFRSGITFETRIPDPLYGEATYHHPRVTPRYFEAQRAVGRLQGRNGLWLAGMYTHDVDCHESAIASAVNIARRLDPASDNLARLKAPATGEKETSSQVPGTQR
jgi:predicted NAD/FAD-binding protein